ncbi:hypothetical protein XHV734_1238 [Xanthomonas hortorum pv. vitians]|nr:hypothetical protein XHV734_1238 [Xanthomonas hortorum pv. vitians]
MRRHAGIRGLKHCGFACAKRVTATGAWREGSMRQPLRSPDHCAARLDVGVPTQCCADWV